MDPIRCEADKLSNDVAVPKKRKSHTPRKFSVDKHREDIKPSGITISTPSSERCSKRKRDVDDFTDLPSMSKKQRTNSVQHKQDSYACLIKNVKHSSKGSVGNNHVVGSRGVAFEKLRPKSTSSVLKSVKNAQTETDLNYKCASPNKTKMSNLGSPTSKGSRSSKSYEIDALNRILAQRKTLTLSPDKKSCDSNKKIALTVRDPLSNCNANEDMNIDERLCTKDDGSDAGLHRRDFRNACTVNGVSSGSEPNRGDAIGSVASKTSSELSADNIQCEMVCNPETSSSKTVPELHRPLDLSIGLRSNSLLTISSEPSYSVPSDSLNYPVSAAVELCTPIKLNVSEVKTTKANQGDESIISANESAHSTASSTEMNMSIQLLTDQLCSLNQECSHIATHVYRRQTPKRKRTDATQKRSLSTPRKHPSAAAIATQPFSAFALLKSPRTTPRRHTCAPTSIRKRIVCNGCTPRKEKEKSMTKDISPVKFATPSRSKTKRKLYAESPEKFVTFDLENLANDASISYSCFKPDFCIATSTLDPEPVTTSHYDSPDESTNKPACEPMDEPTDELTDEPMDRLKMDVPDENSHECSFVIDDKIDAALEATSQRINLTAKNVRSILHELITNDQVKEMVRDTLTQEGDLKTRLQDAIFEPKLTRSKLKLVIQSGQVPPPWSLTPVKSSRSAAEQNFLEMSFPDDEDDDEYRPSESELETSTPLSSLMGPPVNKLLRSLGAVSAGTAEAGQGVEEEVAAATIALRTRSKLPLVHLDLDVIESSYVAPDITPDMYDTYCDDKDWNTFLSGLMKGDPASQGNETGDEDPNDPEFDFLEAIEQDEEQDEEEVRNDRAVRVSKKELSSLMNELFEAYCEDNDDDVTMSNSKLRSLTSTVVDKDRTVSKSSELAEPSNSTKPASNPGMGGKSKLNQSVDESGINESVDESRVNESVGESQLNDEVDDRTICAEQFQYPGHIPPLKFDSPFANVFIAELMKIKDQEGRAKVESDASQSMLKGELAQLRDQMNKSLYMMKFVDGEVLFMSQYVQLLAQTFVQAAANPQLDDICSMSASYLNELKTLADESPQPSGQSFFQTPNLNPAIVITQQSFTKDNKPLDDMLHFALVDKVMSQKMCEVQGLNYKQMSVFASSPVFMFPQMLPDYSLLAGDEYDHKIRVYFSTAEDNLLALGMDQFGHLRGKYNFIHQFLVPVKSTNQLMFRFKNLKSSRTPENAIKYLCRHKHLPEFPKYLYPPSAEGVATMLVPCDRNRDWMPKWFAVFEETRLAFDSGMKNPPWANSGIEFVVCLLVEMRQSGRVKKSSPVAGCDKPKPRGLVLPRSATVLRLQSDCCSSAALSSQPTPVNPVSSRMPHMHPPAPSRTITRSQSAQRCEVEEPKNPNIAVTSEVNKEPTRCSQSTVISAPVAATLGADTSVQCSVTDSEFSTVNLSDLMAMECTTGNQTHQFDANTAGATGQTIGPFTASLQADWPFGYPAQQNSDIAEDYLRMNRSPSPSNTSEKLDNRGCLTSSVVEDNLSSVSSMVAPPQAAVLTALQKWIGCSPGGTTDQVIVLTQAQLLQLGIIVSVLPLPSEGATVDSLVPVALSQAQQCAKQGTAASAAEVKGSMSGSTNDEVYPGSFRLDDASSGLSLSAHASKGPMKTVDINAMQIIRQCDQVQNDRLESGSESNQGIEPQNLISRAFSFATGIPVEDLQCASARVSSSVVRTSELQCSHVAVEASKQMLPQHADQTRNGVLDTVVNDAAKVLTDAVEIADDLASHDVLRGDISLASKLGLCMSSDSSDIGLERLNKTAEAIGSVLNTPVKSTPGTSMLTTPLKSRRRTTFATSHVRFILPSPHKSPSTSIRSPFLPKTKKSPKATNRKCISAIAPRSILSSFNSRVDQIAACVPACRNAGTVCGRRATQNAEGSFSQLSQRKLCVNRVCSSDDIGMTRRTVAGKSTRMKKVDDDNDGDGEDNDDDDDGLQVAAAATRTSQKLKSLEDSSGTSSKGKRSVKNRRGKTLQLVENDHQVSDCVVEADSTTMDAADRQIRRPPAGDGGVKSSSDPRDCILEVVDARANQARASIHVDNSEGSVLQNISVINLSGAVANSHCQNGEVFGTRDVSLLEPHLLCAEVLREDHNSQTTNVQLSSSALSSNFQISNVDRDQRRSAAQASHQDSIDLVSSKNAGAIHSEKVKECLAWTREEDRTILGSLTALRTPETAESTIWLIADILKSRTIDEVKIRSLFLIKEFCDLLGSDTSDSDFEGCDT